MKQFKNLSALLLVLVTMAMFTTSCQKDDEKKLEGTWRLYSAEDDEGIYYEEDEVLAILKSGGKGEFRYNGEVDEIIRWHADDNYLYIRYYDDETGEYDDDDDPIEYNLTNDGKTLILYQGAIETWHKQ